MRRKFIMGNWKMNGNRKQITLLLQDILTALSAELQDVFLPQMVVFPPSIYIPLVAELLQDKFISWGAQNIYPKDYGAYTGELSVPMLLDYACRYVLVGHSERRNFFKENEKFVAEKFHHVKERDMIPILCVGETLEERQQGMTETILTQQLEPIVSIARNEGLCFKNCVIAYEPVWAIGTGLTPEPAQVQEVHQFIRSWVNQLGEEEGERLPIVYGGSVTEKNAHSLFAMPDVDGGLIGGASLHARQFVDIVRCIN